MRITNKIIQNNSINNINGNKVLEDNLNTQLATGKKINRPSDDPVIAIRSLRLRTSLSEINQYYKKNVPDAKNWLKITEDAVDTTISLITDMYSDCQSGSEGFKTADDRSAILGNLKGIRDEIFSAGNSEYAGRYVFTGYRTGTSLAFPENTKQTYSITEQFDSSRLEDINYIATGTLDKITTSNALANTTEENDITQNNVHRIRLSYNTCDKDVVPKITYYNGTVKTDITATIAAAGTDPYLSQAGNNADGATFIPETGELILSDSLFAKLQAAHDDEATTNINEGEISVTYQKTDFAKNDLRPEHYFYCETSANDPADPTRIIKFNEGLLTGDDSDLTQQYINYDIGFGQEIRINTNASEVYTHDIKRDLEDLIASVEDVISMENTVATLKEKINNTTNDGDKATLQTILDAANKALTFLEDKMQKTFESGIGKTQNYLNRTNTAMTNIGNRSARVELVENRLSSQQTSFETLTSDNDDADVTEVAVQLSSVEMTYQAALMATGKITQTTLLNYI